MPRPYMHFCCGSCSLLLCFNLQTVLPRHAAMRSPYHAFGHPPRPLSCAFLPSLDHYVDELYVLAVTEGGGSDRCNLVTGGIFEEDSEAARQQWASSGDTPDVVDFFTVLQQQQQQPSRARSSSGSHSEAARWPLA